MTLPSTSSALSVQELHSRFSCEYHLLQILNKWVETTSLFRLTTVLPARHTHIALPFFCQLPVSRLELQQALKSQAARRRHLAMSGRDMDKKWVEMRRMKGFHLTE